MELVDARDGVAGRYVDIEGDYLEVRRLLADRSHSVGESRAIIRRASSEVLRRARGRPVVMLCRRGHARLWRRMWRSLGLEVEVLASGLDLRCEGWTSQEDILKMYPTGDRISGLTPVA